MSYEKLRENAYKLMKKTNFTDKELDYFKKLLLKCNDVYYNSGEEPILTDFEYDSLLVKYNELNKDNKLTTLTSAKKGKRLVNVEHEYPELVGTLDKTTNMEEFKEWFLGKCRDIGIKANQEIELVISNKEDGNSLCGTFRKDGTVESFLTRGKDGQGADMTELFKHIKVKPNVCNSDFGMKFEAIMTTDNFNAYNEIYQEKNGKSLSSSRSAVAGILSSDEGYKYIQYVTLVPLTIKIQNKPNLNKLDQIKYIEKMIVGNKSFRHINYNVIKGNYKEIYKQVKDLYKKTNDTRMDLDAPIDGLVIEFNNNEIREKLGREDDRNKFDVALKFPALAKRTKVKDIKFYQGKTGRITPVVYFDSVIFNGNKCENVSIANYKRFKELNLSKGDSVIITYNNDVLCYLHPDPDNKNNKKDPIPFITKCPSCGEKLSLNSNKTFVFCKNPNCKSNLIGKLENYLIKIGVKGIKNSTLTKLMDANVVNCIEDFYRLDKSKLLTVDGILEKSADNILKAIAEKNSIYDYELLGSLHIEQFGRRSAKVLTAKYSLDEIMELIKNKGQFIIKVCELEGFSDITANYIYNGIIENMDTINFLRDKLTIKQFKNNNSNTGKTYKFVLTGFRDKELQEKLEEMGHSILGSVSSKTDYLVVKDLSSNSSKTKKAKDLGVQIISKEQLLELVNL